MKEESGSEEGVSRPLAIYKEEWSKLRKSQPSIAPNVLKAEAVLPTVVRYVEEVMTELHGATITDLTLIMERLNKLEAHSEEVKVEHANGTLVLIERIKKLEETIKKGTTNGNKPRANG